MKNLKLLYPATNITEIKLENHDFTPRYACTFSLSPHLQQDAI